MSDPSFTPHAVEYAPIEEAERETGSLSIRIDWLQPYVMNTRSSSSSG